MLFVGIDVFVWVKLLLLQLSNPELFCPENINLRMPRDADGHPIVIGLYFGGVYLVLVAVNTMALGHPTGGFLGFVSPLLINVGIAALFLLLIIFRTCRTWGVPAVHIGELARRIHGNNRDAAWSATYGTRQRPSVVSILRAILGVRKRRRISAESEGVITLDDTESRLLLTSEETDEEHSRREQEQLDQQETGERQARRDRRQRQLEAWRKRGRQLGLDTAEFARQRIFPIFVYPIALIFRVSDRVSHEMLGLENRRAREQISRMEYGDD